MSTYKASVFNYLFNSVNAVIMIVNGIIMVPVYLHYMSVSTYGAWLATGNIVSMLGLIESGFASVITQKMSVAIANRDDILFLKYAGANLVTALFFSGIILIVGLSISPFVADWVNVEDSVSDDIRLSFVIALIAACISLIVSLNGAFPQVWQDTKSVGILNTVSNLMAIFSLVIFLIVGLGVVSIALSYLVRALLNLVLQGLWILRHWKKRGLDKPVFDVTTIKNLFKACVYPFLSKLSGVFMGHSQSFIIAYFMNPALSAIFDITTKVCSVACTFVSQTNGSFFALFSLTMASKDQKRITDVFKKTSIFFFVSLFTVALYSMCFSEPVIRYWVGLDKFGGTLLLIISVLATIIGQVRRYFNNIIYTGGLINKSAILDILCTIVYLLILSLIIKSVQIYALPLASLTTNMLFLILYLRILKIDLKLEVNGLVKIALSSAAIIIPFVLVHFAFGFDYENVFPYLIYVVAFTILYGVVVYVANKDFVKLLMSKFKH